MSPTGRAHIVAGFFDSFVGVVMCHLTDLWRSCVWMQEVQDLLRLLQGDIDTSKIVRQTLTELPSLTRQVILGWSERILSS